MGVTGIIIGLAVILIALLLIFPFFSDSFVKLQSEFDNTVEAQAIGNKPKSGDVVCDLKITVFGELDFANQDGRTVILANPFETNLVVFMNKKTAHPEIAQYQWFNCYKSGTFPLAMLFGGVTGYELLTEAKQLDVSGIALGDSFTMKISGESDDGRLLIDKFGRTAWEKRVDVPDGSQIKIPYGFSVRYTLDDVVFDDYELKVQAVAKSINNMPANQPYIYHVVK